MAVPNIVFSHPFPVWKIVSSHSAIYITVSGFSMFLTAAENHVRIPLPQSKQIIWRARPQFNGIHLGYLLAKKMWVTESYG